MSIILIALSKVPLLQKKLVNYDKNLQNMQLNAEKRKKRSAMNSFGNATAYL